MGNGVFAGAVVGLVVCFTTTLILLPRLLGVAIGLAYNVRARRRRGFPADTEGRSDCHLSVGSVHVFPLAGTLLLRSVHYTNLEWSIRVEEIQLTYRLWRTTTIEQLPRRNLFPEEITSEEDFDYFFKSSKFSDDTRMILSLYGVDLRLVNSSSVREASHPHLDTIEKLVSDAGQTLIEGLNQDKIVPHSFVEQLLNDTHFLIYYISVYFGDPEDKNLVQLTASLMECRYATVRAPHPEDVFRRVYRVKGTNWQLSAVDLSAENPAKETDGKWHEEAELVNLTQTMWFPQSRLYFLRKRRRRTTGDRRKIRLVTTSKISCLYFLDVPDSTISSSISSTNFPRTGLLFSVSDGLFTWDSSGVRLLQRVRARIWPAMAESWELDESPRRQPSVMSVQIVMRGYSGLPLVCVPFRLRAESWEGSFVAKSPSLDETLELKTSATTTVSIKVPLLATPSTSPTTTVCWSGYESSLGFEGALDGNFLSCGDFSINCKLESPLHVGDKCTWAFDLRFTDSIALVVMDYQLLLNDLGAWLAEGYPEADVREFSPVEYKVTIYSRSYSLRLGANDRNIWNDLIDIGDRTRERLIDIRGPNYKLFFCFASTLEYGGLYSFFDWSFSSSELSLFFLIPQTPKASNAMEARFANLVSHSAFRFRSVSPRDALHRRVTGTNEIDWQVSRVRIALSSRHVGLMLNFVRNYTGNFQHVSLLDETSSVPDGTGGTEVPKLQYQGPISRSVTISIDSFGACAYPSPGELFPISSGDHAIRCSARNLEVRSSTCSNQTVSVVRSKTPVLLREIKNVDCFAENFVNESSRCLRISPIEFMSRAVEKSGKEVIRSSSFDIESLTGFVDSNFLEILIRVWRDALQTLPPSSDRVSLPNERLVRRPLFRTCVDVKKISFGVHCNILGNLLVDLPGGIHIQSNNLSSGQYFDSATLLRCHVELCLKRTRELEPTSSGSLTLSVAGRTESGPVPWSHELGARRRKWLLSVAPREFSFLLPEQQRGFPSEEWWSRDQEAFLSGPRSGRDVRKRLYSGIADFRVALLKFRAHATMLEDLTAEVINRRESLAQRTFSLSLLQETWFRCQDYRFSTGGRLESKYLTRLRIDRLEARIRSDCRWTEDDCEALTFTSSVSCISSGVDGVLRVRFVDTNLNVYTRETQERIVKVSDAIVLLSPKRNAQEEDGMDIRATIGRVALWTGSNSQAVGRLLRGLSDQVQELRRETALLQEVHLLRQAVLAARVVGEPLRKLCTSEGFTEETFLGAIRRLGDPAFEDRWLDLVPILQKIPRIPTASTSVQMALPETTSGCHCCIICGNRIDLKVRNTKVVAVHQIRYETTAVRTVKAALVSIGKSRARLSLAEIEETKRFITEIIPIRKNRPVTSLESEVFAQELAASLRPAEFSEAPKSLRTGILNLLSNRFALFRTIRQRLSDRTWNDDGVRDDSSGERGVQLEPSHEPWWKRVLKKAFVRGSKIKDGDLMSVTPSVLTRSSDFSSDVQSALLLLCGTAELCEELCPTLTVKNWFLDSAGRITSASNAEYSSGPGTNAVACRADKAVLSSTRTRTQVSQGKLEIRSESRTIDTMMRSVTESYSIFTRVQKVLAKGPGPATHTQIVQFKIMLLIVEMRSLDFFRYRGCDLGFGSLQKHKGLLLNGQVGFHSVATSQSEGTVASMPPFRVSCSRIGDFQNVAVALETHKQPLLASFLAQIASDIRMLVCLMNERWDSASNEIQRTTRLDISVPCLHVAHQNREKTTNLTIKALRFRATWSSDLYCELQLPSLILAAPNSNNSYLKNCIINYVSVQAAGSSILSGFVDKIEVQGAVQLFNDILALVVLSSENGRKSERKDDLRIRVSLRFGEISLLAPSGRVPQRMLTLDDSDLKGVLTRSATHGPGFTMRLVLSRTQLVAGSERLGELEQLSLSLSMRKDAVLVDASVGSWMLLEGPNLTASLSKLFEAAEEPSTLGKGSGFATKFAVVRARLGPGLLRLSDVQRRTGAPYGPLNVPGILVSGLLPQSGARVLDVTLPPMDKIRERAELVNLILGNSTSNYSRTGPGPGCPTSVPGWSCIVRTSQFDECLVEEVSPNLSMQARLLASQALVYASQKQQYDCERAVTVSIVGPRVQLHLKSVKDRADILRVRIGRICVHSWHNGERKYIMRIGSLEATLNILSGVMLRDWLSTRRSFNTRREDSTESIAGRRSVFGLYLGQFDNTESNRLSLSCLHPAGQLGLSFQGVWLRHQIINGIRDASAGLQKYQIRLRWEHLAATLETGSMRCFGALGRDSWSVGGETAAVACGLNRHKQTLLKLGLKSCDLTVNNSSKQSLFGKVETRDVEALVALGAIPAMRRLRSLLKRLLRESSQAVSVSSTRSSLVDWANQPDDPGPVAATQDRNSRNTLTKAVGKIDVVGARLKLCLHEFSLEDPIFPKVEIFKYWVTYRQMPSPKGTERRMNIRFDKLRLSQESLEGDQTVVYIPNPNISMAVDESSVSKECTFRSLFEQEVEISSYWSHFSEMMKLMSTYRRMLQTGGDSPDDQVDPVFIAAQRDGLVLQEFILAPRLRPLGELTSALESMLSGKDGRALERLPQHIYNYAMVPIGSAVDLLQWK